MACDGSSASGFARTKKGCSSAPRRPSFVRDCREHRRQSVHRRTADVRRSSLRATNRYHNERIT